MIWTNHSWVLQGCGVTNGSSPDLRGEHLVHAGLLGLHSVAHGRCHHQDTALLWKQNRQWGLTLRLNFHTLQSSEGERPHLLVLLIFHIWARTRLSASTSLLLPSRQWRGKWDLVECTALILQYFAHHGMHPSILVAKTIQEYMLTKLSLLSFCLLPNFMSTYCI